MEPFAEVQGEAMWRSRRKELEGQYEALLKEFGAGLSRLVASYETRRHDREDLLQGNCLANFDALA
jgi:hypothetical protein